MGSETFKELPGKLGSRFSVCNLLLTWIHLGRDPSGKDLKVVVPPIYTWYLWKFPKVEIWALVFLVTSFDFRCSAWRGERREGWWYCSQAEGEGKNDDVLQWFWCLCISWEVSWEEMHPNLRRMRGEKRGKESSTLAMVWLEICFS